MHVETLRVLAPSSPPACCNFHPHPPPPLLPTVGEVKQTRQNDVIPRTLSFLSLPVLYKHSCLRGMLAWENINHWHE